MSIPPKTIANHAPILEPKQYEDKGGNIDSSSSLHLSSDGTTCEKQDERHYSFIIPPAQKLGTTCRILAHCRWRLSRHSNLREQTEDLISNPSPPPSDKTTIYKPASTISSLILSMEGKRKGIDEQAAVQTSSSYILSRLRCQLLNRHWIRGGLRSGKTLQE